MNLLIGLVGALLGDEFLVRFNDAPPMYYRERLARMVTRKWAAILEAASLGT